MDKRKYCGHCGKLMVEKGPIPIEKWDNDSDKYDNETGKRRMLMFFACPDYKSYGDCLIWQSNWRHDARSVKIILI